MKRINQFRTSILLFALTIIMGFLNLAFRYTTYPNEDISHYQLDDEEDKPMEIIRTPPPKKPKKLPPPDPEIIDETDDVLDDDFDDPTADDIDSLTFDSSLMIIDSTISVPSKPTAVDNTQPPSPPAPTSMPEPKSEILTMYTVEKMPFMGDCHGLDREEMEACFLKSFMGYISKHIKYPAMARQNNIEGRVVIQFVVGKTGALKDIDIMYDIGGGCGAEAARVVKSMPKWSPGIQRGRPVEVKFTMPIKFDLQ